MIVVDFALGKNTKHKNQTFNFFLKTLISIVSYSLNMFEFVFIIAALKYSLKEFHF